MLAELISSVVSHVDLTTGLLFVVVALVTWHFYNDYNLPPGPWGVPIVGYLPFMKSGNAEDTFNDLTKKYGKVWSLRLGSHLVVVLGTYDAIKEAFVKQGDNFSGRPQGRMMRLRDDESNVIISDGELWREHRRFALSTLRDYGMGKLSLEPRITEEVHFFLDEIDKQGGNPYDFGILLGMSTANIIATMEFGKRFEYTDTRFEKLRRIIDELMEVSGAVPLGNVFPWMTKFSIFEPLTKYQALLKIDDSFKEFVRDMVAEHEAAYEENSKRDYIDAYLTERKSIVKKTGSDGYFNYTDLEGTLQNLYGAGTETTTSTIKWAIHYLLLHPEMQEKVQKEIDDVVGLERAPTMADKSQMPFTDAFLLEAARCGTIIPMGVPHSNLEETTLFGYRIPKRTIIMGLHWAAHMDPQLWKDPEKFSPERFLDEKGEAQKPEHLMPFGIGKRACLGESLARMELFLYFTSMLQCFTFLPPDGTKPVLSYESVGVRRPKPFKVNAVQREGYHVS